MTVFIHRLETSVPETHYDQSFACELMQRNVSERTGVRRMLRSIYHHSGIRKRHSVISDFSKPGASPLFFNNDGSRVLTPDTRKRNDVYTREARKLFTDLGRKLIHNTPGFSREDVTHVVTVSCTGFFAPGPDYYVVRDLGLPGSTQRYHIGFMGCYAAFQGLKMADAICRSEPGAVVLVLCVELCTLHLQFSDDTDAMISASVFADGGAGALVSSRTPQNAGPFRNAGTTPDATEKLSDNASPGIPTRAVPPETPSVTAPAGKPSGAASPPVLEMISFHNDLTSEGEQDMAWTIGNQGFEMRLSTYVPDIIRSNIGPMLNKILQGAGLQKNDIGHWAVHPGGRAILDKVRDALDLDEAQLGASRSVLREYGNMSSATILFVLKEMMDRYAESGLQSGSASGPQDTSYHASQNASQHGSQDASQHAKPAKPSSSDTVFAMAFGPGLTIETGLLRFVPSMPASPRQSARASRSSANGHLSNASRIVTNA